MIDLVSFGRSSVRVANLDFANAYKTQTLDYGLWQNKTCGPGVDYSYDSHSPDLFRRNQALLSSKQVFVIGHFKLNGESSHPVGSFGSHGLTAPFRSKRCPSRQCSRTFSKCNKKTSLRRRW